VTALPRRMYKDPAEQLLDAEAETCKGCVHVEHWRGADHCQSPKTKAVLAERRCENYEEKV
jgi:hypothetical protein